MMMIHYPQATDRLNRGYSQDIYPQYHTEPPLTDTDYSTSTIIGPGTDADVHDPYHYTLQTHRTDDESDQPEPTPNFTNSQTQRTRLHRCLLPNCSYPGGQRYQHAAHSWLDHVLDHFSGLPNRPSEDWNYDIYCHRCTFSFRNRSWNTIVRHIYDRHIQRHGDLRTVRNISPSLTRYLEFKAILNTGPDSQYTERADNEEYWDQMSDQNVGYQPQAPRSPQSASEGERWHTLAHIMSYDFMREAS